MIDLDLNTCKQLIDKILSIMSDKYNEHFTIEKTSNKLVILTKARAMCFINVRNVMFFKDEKHILDLMMKHSLNFYDGNFNLKKELGSTIEEIMIVCDLKTK